MNKLCGIVALYGPGSNPTPLRPTQSNPPIREFPGENASEYPMTTQRIEITASGM